MTINDELLKILVCPVNHQPLRLLNESELSAFNQRIENQEVTNVSGKTVDSVCSGALIEEKSGRIYPIIDSIPVLLIDESILYTQ